MITLKRTIRTGALFLPLTLVLACGGGPPGSPRNDASTTPRPTVVGPENLAVVRSDSVQTGPVLSGTLVSENEASVRAQISATVLATYADIGTRVTRGTRLAQLDGRALEDATLSARSAMRSAQTAAENAERAFARQERLLAVEAVAQADVDAARNALASTEANLADARSRLSSAEQQARYANVTAPITGVVSEKAVSTGDAVQVGGALFTIIDPASMRLEAHVAAEALSGVKVGTPVSFSIRGYPDQRHDGRITRVSPAADRSTRQVQVFASIPNAGSTLVAGLFASGRVASKTAAGPIAPTDAIDGRQVTPAVVRLRNGQIERITVTLGLRDEETKQVQILSGVAAGDTLLTGTAQQLSAGTRVLVTRGDSTARMEARR